MSNNNRETAAKVAQFLLQAQAVKLQPTSPFTWASGWKSPIYCDNRVTLSYPNIRTYIRQQLAKVIVDKFGKPDVSAGGATGAIAQGALVAEELGLPFVYVRSAPKEHGLSNLIEGRLEKGQSVVVVEDLISTGGCHAQKHVSCDIEIVWPQIVGKQFAFRSCMCAVSLAHRSRFHYCTNSMHILAIDIQVVIDQGR